MDDIPTLRELAERLALELCSGDGAAKLHRHGWAVELPDALLARLDTASLTGRHLAYGVLSGCRLAIDRSASGFDPSQERPDKPKRVFHPHEMPSVYGERLPRLLPQLAVRWLEALTGEVAITQPWVVDGLAFVYVLETGKYLHTLCESDLDKMSLTRDKLLRDARHALFYDAYKLKPKQEERTEAGRVRVFRTVEGLGASRAMLLPDFDYDAAREHGCFSTPSRDTLIIGRPAAIEHSDAICRRVEALSAQMIAQEPFPLTTMIGRLQTDKIEPGEHVIHELLPPGREAVEAVEPPEDTVLERLQDN